MSRWTHLSIIKLDQNLPQKYDLPRLELEKACVYYIYISFCIFRVGGGPGSIIV